MRDYIGYIPMRSSELDYDQDQNFNSALLDGRRAKPSGALAIMEENKTKGNIEGHNTCGVFEGHVTLRRSDAFSLQL